MLRGAHPSHTAKKTKPARGSRCGLQRRELRGLEAVDLGEPAQEGRRQSLVRLAAPLLAEPVGKIHRVDPKFTR